MVYYINFYFKNLVYDEKFYVGHFSSPDDDVCCEFEYDRVLKTFKIWNNNRPIEEIIPIPVWWLDLKLKQNGDLKENEYKISW